MKKFNWFLIFLFLASGTYARSLYKIDGNKVTVDLEGIGVKSRMLRVEIWSPRSVKLISGMSVEFSDFNSLIANEPQEAVKFKVGYAYNNIEITTSELLISIQEDGLVRIYNRDGNKLLIESDRTFQKNNDSSESYRVKQRYFLNPNERIFGFGQTGETPRYCLRNLSFQLKQDEENIATPLFFSEKGYAMIWDNYSSTLFSDARSGLELESVIGEEIQYFFIYGPDWETIVSEIRSISGIVPMLPRWAFGHWLIPDDSDIKTGNLRNEYLLEGIPVETVSSEYFPLFEKEMAISLSKDKQENDPVLNMASYIGMAPEYEKVVEQATSERPCIPTHINFPGIQKYGTFLLSGIKINNWDALKCQVVSGINYSLSGQPYWTSSGIEHISPEGLTPQQYSELMLRWYQYAVFNPVFASSPKGSIISFKNTSPEYFNQMKKAVELRYRLLPYIYSTAHDVVANNKTFVRSLLFDYPDDEKATMTDNQFLFGKSIMVCPVVEPGIKQKSIYLPKGNDWFDFYTGIRYEGGNSIDVEITNESIPVFVKAGSVIPFATIGSNSADSLFSPMEIRIYPSDNAEFVLYEDAGDGNGYKNGESSVIRFTYTGRNNVLVVDPAEGTYPGMETNRMFRVVVVEESVGNGMDFSEPPTWLEYSGKRERLKL
ncbi:MAG: glycoside hydrolase family 31 protein [Prolixibacteraceae bacterium]|nr:glycoside hydrolase family 31 protein [Prolixibacteraceae bacterium]